MGSRQKKTAMALDCTAVPWQQGIWAAHCASTVPAPGLGRRLPSNYRSSLRRLFMAKSTPVNRRILIIDDNQDIHRDFRKVIGGGLDDDGALAAAELAILGESPPASMTPSFEIDSALQGQDGGAKVRQALDEGRPYAMAFVGMRMPPGW